jgi:hypothetical protein
VNSYAPLGFVPGPQVIVAATGTPGLIGTGMLDRLTRPYVS